MRKHSDGLPRGALRDAVGPAAPTPLQALIRLRFCTLLSFATPLDNKLRVSIENARVVYRFFASN